jgi:crossover junction endodeoxyribonuclease RuvC
MIIIGLDPGLRHTGWGIIRSVDNRIHVQASGRISVKPNLSLGERLAKLSQELGHIIESYAPDHAAVEETFVNKNPGSTLKLGMARGIVMAAPAMHNIPVYEYPANTVKKAVVGAGHADKNQMMAMVKMLLPKARIESPDEADALAIAICHAHHAPTHALKEQNV